LNVPIRVDADLERRYPAADRLATEAVVNLVRAEGLISAEVTKWLRRAGLSVATFNVLMILQGAKEPLCPYQIGERLLVTRGTVTGLLDSLEKAGLIRRIPHPDDRRMLLIEPTQKALNLLEEILPEHFANEAALLAGLTDREKATFVKLLGKVQASVHERP
jgi:DNA-binding MarR family transcriptional regulator